MVQGVVIALIPLGILLDVICWWHRHLGRFIIYFEMLQLKKRIAELEKQLKDAEMKAIAFSTMVDIAEEEFKIPIRKKFNTKL